MSQAVRNRDNGSFFEAFLEHQAKLLGLLVKKNKLTAQYTYNGRVQVEKSELDFTLGMKPGRVAFVDAKSFNGDRFTFSDLSENQIERAAWYNEWRIPAGFVVYLRKIGGVVFISGETIKKKGPRNSFGIEDGILLGKFPNANLRLIFGETKNPL